MVAPRPEKRKLAAYFFLLSFHLRASIRSRLFYFLFVFNHYVLPLFCVVSMNRNQSIASQQSILFLVSPSQYDYRTPWKN